MRITHTIRTPYSQARAWMNNHLGSNSTLYVPRHLEQYMRQRIKEHKSLRRYFAHLIMTYGFHQDYYQSEAYTSFCKKKYQLPRKGYRRFDFRPDSMFWEHLRHLSFIYGPSMCWLFVHLVKLEQKRWMEAGSPENFKETPPRRPENQGIIRNSGKMTKKARQIIKEILQNHSARTILVRVMDSSSRILTRTGQIRM